MDDHVAPSNVLAILLGATTFPRASHLGTSPSFANSARAIRNYLLSEDGFGLPPANLLDLFDSDASPSDQDEQIAMFLEQRVGKNGPTDLLIYYVGHGGFAGSTQDYYLAIKTTRRNAEGVSSIRVTDLARTIRENARHLRRYLILDCCFSSAAYAEFQSAPADAARVKVLEVLPRRGTALLCSSSRQNTSRAPTGEQYTMFSGALLDALRGHAHVPRRWLSLSDVGQEAADLIRDRYAGDAVRPEVHAPDQREGDVALVPLFPNLAACEIVEEVAPAVAVKPPPLSREQARRFAIEWSTLTAAVAMTLSTIFGTILRLLPASLGVGVSAAIFAAVVATIQSELLHRFAGLPRKAWLARTFFSVMLGAIAVRAFALEPDGFDLPILLPLALHATAGLMIGFIQHRALRRIRPVPWWPAVNALAWMATVRATGAPTLIAHLLALGSYVLPLSATGVLLAIAWRRAQSRPPRVWPWFVMSVFLLLVLWSIAVFINGVDVQKGSITLLDGSGGGSVAGAVTNGGALPGVTVNVIAASKTHTVYTDVHGHYNVAGLLPGVYEVVVSLEGLGEARVGMVIVVAGAVTPIDVELLPRGSQSKVATGNVPFRLILFSAAAMLAAWWALRAHRRIAFTTSS